MSIVVGIARLARFRPDGFAAFSATRQALFNSMAPLLAFPLVGGLIQLTQGDVAAAMSGMLLTIVALLTPLVVTEFFARRWGVQDRWLRFVVASNWCQWALPVLLLGTMTGLWLLARLGVPAGEGAVGGGIVCVMVYGIALHWFLARSGLGLSRGRAALLVLAADFSTGLLILGPKLLAAA